MSKKKNLIILLISCFVLIGITVSLVLFFILNPKTTTEEEFSLSPIEEVTLDTSNKEILYFENLNFLKNNLSEAMPHLKNVIIYDNEKIILKNISLYDTMGNLSLHYNNDTIKSATFETIELSSTDDVYAVFERINSAFAQENKISVNPIFIVNNNGEKREVSNSNDLFLIDSYLITEYSTPEAKITIQTTTVDNTYSIFLIIERVA